MRRLHRHTPTLAGTVEVVAVATAPVGLNDPSSTVTLYNLPTLLAPDISDESTMIAALFHDLGKVGYPGKPHYLLRPGEGN